MAQFSTYRRQFDLGDLRLGSLISSTLSPRKILSGAYAFRRIMWNGRASAILPLRITEADRESAHCIRETIYHCFAREGSGR